MERASAILRKGCLRSRRSARRRSRCRSDKRSAEIFRSTRQKIRKPSEHRVTPPCPVYDQCGGCQLQHLAYSQQLREKRDIVIQSLERHTRFNVEEMNIKETIGMDNPWNYRNKSQFQVGRSQSGSIIAGLYGLDSHKIVPIKECIVQHPATNKTTGIVRRILEKHNVSVYNERTKKAMSAPS